MKFPIYLDYQATTPVDPRVLEAMLPCFNDEFGNAASKSHSYGWRAEKKVEQARAQIAAIIGATSEEIVFTSGATESNNIAILGVAEFHPGRGHMITQATEHKAVLDTMKYLETKGWNITVLPVDSFGRINTDELEKSITDETILISIMSANNEIGTVQPIRKIGAIAKKKNVLFHVDASQAVGKIPLNVQTDGIDLLSFTAHKMYGPKGVGALYVRKKDPYVKVAPLFYGGGHERGMRSGTLNVAGIVGFGKACEIAAKEILSEASHLIALRDRLYSLIQKDVKDFRLNGHSTERLPGNLNISFDYLEGDSLMMAIQDELAVSSGSACTSAKVEPSHVLKAIGVPNLARLTSIRFGMGRFTTQEEIDYAASCVSDAVKRLREIQPYSKLQNDAGKSPVSR